MPSDGLEAYDMPAVREILHQAADNDNRFSPFMLGVVQSAPFQMRRSGVMIVTKRSPAAAHLPARAGATLGLPLLDAMVPALRARDAPQAIRLGFIYLPNGVSMNFTGVNYWRPKAKGSNFELSPILTPLAAYRNS